MYLSGSNTIKSGDYFAGIHVDQGAELTISSKLGDFSTSGNLEVTGGLESAGIGGSIVGTGTITINGGTIIANGGEAAAGIGGEAEGTVTINGGNVTARGGSFTEENPEVTETTVGFRVGAGAGIGGCGSVEGRINNMNITITGGTVNATGGTSRVRGYDYLYGAAGIGGGMDQDSGRIRIGAGASVTATPGASNMLPSTTGGVTEADPIGRGWGGVNKDVVENDASIIPPSAREIPEKDKITSEETLPNSYRTLDEISQFYTSEGVFTLSQPKTLTITQGDGQTASVTLYAKDTIEEVTRKINDAIANTLGQAKYTDNPNKFCTLSDGTLGTSESVAACESEREAIFDEDMQFVGFKYHDSMYKTMLIRSAVPGKAGELSFSGDDDLLRALGLNTIQESEELRLTASVYDTHSGKIISSNKKITGNVIYDAVKGVDVELDILCSGIKSSWNENSKQFISQACWTEFIHLKDNGITFQTGTNDGENFSVQLGDMSSYSLGISSVNVVTRESASRSISMLDRAINRVSSQRAKIGAYTNSLEHTMTNLTTTASNLSDAESRIRDADMAGAMMKFVRLQILNQSGTSMLAQANQLPQSLLSLLGN